MVDVTKLEVVNACLATMGESPLNTLEDDHSYKASALQVIVDSNRNEQKRGWWFNSEYVRLFPDAISKYIAIPGDALSVKPIEKITPAFGQRGKRLYDSQRNRYEWDWPVWVDLVREIEFENLPYHAADVVKWSAVMRFQRDFDGDNTRYQQLSQDFGRARVELVAEDMRNRKHNLLLTVSNQYMMQQIGVGYGPLPRLGIAGT